MISVTNLNNFKKDYTLTTEGSYIIPMGNNLSLKQQELFLQYNYLIGGFNCSVKLDLLNLPSYVLFLY